MKESSARLLIAEMKAAGINFVCYLPDAGFRQFYALAQEDSYFQLIPVTNEWEGVSIAAGAWLGGKKSIMMMENSGLRVASEPLARLGISYGIPVLLLMSYRGSIGEGNWWAINHGVVMEPMLKALRIPYHILNRDDEIEGSLRLASATLSASKYHVATIIGGGLL